MEATINGVFRRSVTPIVQSKYVSRHVTGGEAADKRLVFTPATNGNQEDDNLTVFREFMLDSDGRYVLDSELDAQLIFEKMSATTDHDGGERVVVGSADYASSSVPRPGAGRSG